MVQSSGSPAQSKQRSASVSASGVTGHETLLRSLHHPHCTTLAHCYCGGLPTGAWNVPDTVTEGLPFNSLPMTAAMVNVTAPPLVQVSS